MAAELVPVRLGVTAGDLYTLWAPRWRDAGDGAKKVVNDLRDGSVALLESWAATEPRLRLIRHEHNQGAEATFNPRLAKLLWTFYERKVKLD